MTDERRSSPRVPLDSPIFITLRINEATECPCLVKDFSLGGAMIALPPGKGGTVAEGDHVSITELSQKQCSPMQNIHGLVQWVKGEHFGVSFTSPMTISQEELKDTLENFCF